jgi:hypothetical protein
MIFLKGNSLEILEAVALRHFLLNYLPNSHNLRSLPKEFTKLYITAWEMPEWLALAAGHISQMPERAISCRAGRQK